MKLHMTSLSSDPIRVRWVPTIFMSFNIVSFSLLRVHFQVFGQNSEV